MLSTGSDAAPADSAAPIPAGRLGGPEGNRRLIAATGALLLLLLAAQGVTILFLDRLLTWHFFIGMVLVGPVVLKLGSTGYRIVRYYTGSPAYRRQGPPHPLLRLLGPVVVATTLAVLATGVPSPSWAATPERCPSSSSTRPPSSAGRRQPPSTSWPTCGACPG
ncbi:hypothetical protein ACFQ1I_03280 [Kitasatospora arboriphila]